MSIACPHCGDADIDCDEHEIHCWKCGFRLTKEELKSKEALNMRKELTEEQVAEIKRLADGGMKQKEIAGKVGISLSSVCKYLKVGSSENAVRTSKYITDTSTKLKPGSIGDEIIKRKIAIDKLTDEISILERAVELMESP